MKSCLLSAMLVLVAASEWEGTISAMSNHKRIKCLQNSVEIPARHLMSNGEIIKFRMEMSQRITHQLVTHIFSIYVQEVLGYQGVELIQRTDNFNVTNYLSRLTESTKSVDTVPDVIANLELWLPPETSLYSKKVYDHFKEAGNTGPPGRFGWFFPKQNLNLSVAMDHYSVFLTADRSEMFAVSLDELKQLKQYAINETTGKYFCDSEDICFEGMFIPPRCRYQQCALLLTSYLDATRFVVDHINQLGLYVKVMWVGNYLDTALMEMEAMVNKSRRARSYLFLYWTPSHLVLPEDDRFVSITFPPCETFSASIGCKYDLNRLVKIIWSRLDKAGPYIHNALINMEFTASDYRDLLLRYERRTSKMEIYDVACDWMKDNFVKYDRWTSESVGINELFIGGIFPVMISEYNGLGILWASKMAVDAVNANSSILNGYKLFLLPKDGKCRSDAVIKSFVEFIKADRFPKLAGILGPACSDSVEPLAGVATIYKTVVMSYSAEGSNFSDRVKYPYFFRTIGENYQYTYVYMQLMKQLMWKQVAAITQDGTKYGQYISKLQDKFTEKKMKFLSNRKYPVDREKGSMTKYLTEIKKAKIIIADIYNDAARDAMCEAYKLGMTAKQGYVWFLPMWMNPNWFNTTYYNAVNKENVSCTTEEMIQAINGHLGLSFAHFGRDEDVTLENITVGTWKKQYKEILEQKGDVESIYSGYAYDAVWTYALALDKLLSLNSSYLSNLHNPDTVNLLVQFIADTDFKGVSGRVQFKGRSTRLSDIHVVQWLNNKTRIVGTFHPNDSNPDGGVLKLNESNIVWLTPDRKRPEDGIEKCVVQWIANILDTSCDKALIMLNIVALFALLMFVIVLGVIIKGRYDSRMEFTNLLVKRFGIDEATLDEWEVPHKSVVLNRVLGVGAFGTVYGGEADINGWVPVAVKALKAGSTTEDKLDFLGEAETMKRFDHKNIVKLLGVCTKSPPVYTIMEFMLYGDLKKFLLSRRHLVNEMSSTEDSEEISSRRLTAMALDIARALSYLAESKYVHRDVASRNCLVGSKIVKLGDFGMTRPMFENDQYKFSRKGMLPVRWMAPESLGLGIFSTASDIWSYGVLLYEIVTFGSFPFQGMSNNEVLDHVKAGGTLEIPKKVKPHLEGLISSCWAREIKARPQPSEIVEFLANHPKLITPCLDMPLASVQIENSDLPPHPQIPDKLRKLSTSLRNRSVSSLNNIPRPLPNCKSALTTAADDCSSVVDVKADGYADSQYVASQAHVWNNPTPAQDPQFWNESLSEPLLHRLHNNVLAEVDANAEADAGDEPECKYIAMMHVATDCHQEPDIYIPCNHLPNNVQADSLL